jgi:chromosome segregation ATPase
MAGSSEELRRRIESAVRKRSDLVLKQQRLLGRLEESERALEALKAECRSKNIDPDRIDEAIAKLESALQTSLSQFEDNLSKAEAALDPFTRK